MLLQTNLGEAIVPRQLILCAFRIDSAIKNIRTLLIPGSEMKHIVYERLFSRVKFSRPPNLSMARQSPIKT